MSAFDDLETLLTNLGHKVFANKKLDTVKTAIVYRSISQKIIGSMSGQGGLNIERVQISCYAIKESTLRTMEKDVEDALAFYDSSTLTIIPTESKIEGYDDSRSTFFIHRDFYLIY